MDPQQYPPSEFPQSQQYPQQYPQHYGQQPQQYPQQSGYSQQYSSQAYPPQVYPSQAAQPPQPSYPPQAYPSQAPQQPPPYSPQPYSPQPYASEQPAPPPYLAASQSTEARQAVADRGKRDIIFGAIWLGVGLGITVCSFAYFGGVAGLIAWGPAAYGIYKIIKGIVTINRN